MLRCIFVAVILLAAFGSGKKDKKDEYSDMDERLKVSELQRAKSLDESTALLSASAALREQIRIENAAASAKWERENADLVAERNRRKAIEARQFDSESLAQQLVDRGLAKKEEKSLELAQQVNLDRAREKRSGVYEQEVDGRVIEFKRSTAPPADETDVCQTNPEFCRGTLGIPRWAMPQFKVEGAKTEFLKTAKKLGYQVGHRRVALGDMGVVQSQILDSKAKRIAGEFQAEEKELKKYERKGTLVIGGDALDGHHHFRAGSLTAGAKHEIATDWIYKTDKNGNEIPMSREDKLKLWKASINTKGVTTEDLTTGGLAKAEIQRSFRRFGKHRTRKDDKDGYAYRKEYVMALWNARKQRQAAPRGKSGAQQQQQRPKKQRSAAAEADIRRRWNARNQARKSAGNRYAPKKQRSAAAEADIRRRWAARNQSRNTRK